MKSARPKVLHRVAGRADDRARPRDRRAPSTPRPSTVVVGHQADALQRGAGGASRPHLCGPGATTRHRPRAADGRAGAAQARRARWSCCPATCRCCRPKRCRTLVDRHATTRRGRDRRDRRRRRPARLRPNRPVRRADCTYCRGAGRDARPSGRSARSTPAFTRSRSTGCSTPFAASRRRTRSASTTCPISSAIYRRRGPRRRNRDRRRSRRDPGHQQPRANWRQ